MKERRPFCSDLSRENGEPLGATASRIDRWLLVEYRSLWARDALAGSGLSDQVKAHLREQIRSVANARLLFIRRPDRRHAESLIAFSADAREGHEQLRRFELGKHEELRDLDLLDEATGTRLDHPLFLVCTHGKHDRCCARYGRPVYAALREQADESWIWQSSHVGGDRFAGNVVCLPEGLYFGRVGRPDADELLREYAEGAIRLAHYRGRSCYPFPVQAAELAVRQREGLTGFHDLLLNARSRIAPDRWRVELLAELSGDVHEVEVGVELGPEEYLTCKAGEPKRARRFVALSHRRV